MRDSYSEMVDFRFHSQEEFGTRESMEALFHLLAHHGGPFRPERYGPAEPLRYRFSADQLTEFLEVTRTGMQSTGPKPYQATLNLLTFEGRTWFSMLLGLIHERYFTDHQRVEEYVEFLKSLYAWGRMTHGYVCHGRDFEAKNSIPMMTGGMRLTESLPGIYWANFFGPAYVEFFGRKRFLTVPAYAKEELEDGGFLLLTSASPLDYAAPEVQKLERAIRRHLGDSAFFDRAKPFRRCRAPKFVFPEPTEPTLRPLPIATIFPDPARFIADAPSLADACATRWRLDYTPKSLRKLDTAMMKRPGAPEDNEENLRLAREATAYYGEMLCRHLGGQWALSHDGGEVPVQPIVLIPTDGEPMREAPYIRVLRAWVEKERPDGTEVRFHLLATGEWQKFEQVVKTVSRLASKSAK